MKNSVLAFALSAFLSLPAINCPITATPAGPKGNTSPHGHIRAGGEMTLGRAAHTSTLLSDGRVLVVGGFETGGSSLPQAEVFVPEKSNFQPAGSLATARAGHTATLLPDGLVLIAGGFNGSYLDSSEIFDPRTGRFSPGARLTMPRSEHTATRLADGRILLAGGVGTGWTFLSDAEIYDPQTGRFTPTGRMSTPRESHTATLLQNGKVLITGGHKDRRAAITIFSTTETYDPGRGVFEPEADLTVKRHKHDAVRLSDGRVLISGGSDERDSRGVYTSLEILDPTTRKFQNIGEMTASRYKLNGAVILLRNGKVLLAGGAESAEIFDPKTSSISRVDGTFGSKRLFATATLLADDRVLIAGGYDESNRVSRGFWLFEQASSSQ